VIEGRNETPVDAKKLDAQARRQLPLRKPSPASGSAILSGDSKAVVLWVKLRYGGALRLGWQWRLLLARIGHFLNA